MSKELRHMKRLMARKMSSRMGLKVRMPGKEAAREMFRAKVNKEKLPEFGYPHSSKDHDYAKMSIAEWEKKYL